MKNSKVNSLYTLVYVLIYIAKLYLWLATGYITEMFDLEFSLGLEIKICGLVLERSGLGFGSKVLTSNFLRLKVETEAAYNLN